MKIKEESIIYIFSPINYGTGGPEALHQLGNVLHKLHRNVFMYYYYNDTNNSNQNVIYSEYNVPFTKNIINDENNILIVPETFLSPIFNQNFNRTQKLIWWLSVTNYKLTLEEIKKDSKSFLYKIKQILKPEKHPSPPTIKKLIESKANNLAHSYFSKVFLEQNHLQVIGKLTDYMNNVFKKTYQVDIKRENQIIYNPKKNGKFLNKIIALLPDIKWTPIANISPIEVAELMNRSKLYIDFGYHPGQERMPREAILMGCCIITGKKGSAKFYEDVPLENKFKYEDIDSNIPEIISTILECLNDFDNQIKFFESYRKLIIDEEQTFENNVSELFKVNSN